MAHIYTIRCPKCGKEYEVMKGILMSECGLDPMPKEREFETPVKCPKCGFEFSIQDEKYQENVMLTMLAD